MNADERAKATERMRIWKAKPGNREKSNMRANERAKARLIADPEWRAKRNLKQKAYAKRRYYADVEAARARTRDAANKWRKENPEKVRELHRQWKYKQLVKKYGPLDAFDHVKCEICRVLFDETIQNRRTLDHCHKTGLARGFVCHRCNVMIGMAGDKAGLMTAAARYLKRFNAAKRNGASW